MALLPCGENAREAGENQEGGVILLRGFLTWFSQRLLAACFARAVRAAPFGTLAHRRAAIATACGFFSASIVLHYPINRQALSMRAQALDARMRVLVLFMRLHRSIY